MGLLGEWAGVGNHILHIGGYLRRTGRYLQLSSHCFRFLWCDRGITHVINAFDCALESELIYGVHPILYFRFHTLKMVSVAFFVDQLPAKFTFGLDHTFYLCNIGHSDFALFLCLHTNIDEQRVNCQQQIPLFPSTASAALLFYSSARYTEFNTYEQSPP